MPRIPRFRDLKSKLYSAKLLGNVVKNSLAFKLRRGTMPRYRAKEFDTIIVDMDGTLYRTDANLEALVLAYPEQLETGRASGEELYDSIISKIASGEYGIEKAIVEGNKFLMARGIKRQDFHRLVDVVKPALRKPLIKGLADIKAEGKTIVLATLSSKDLGEMVNAYLKLKYKFEFDLVVGTELKFSEDGSIAGLKSIIGTKDFTFEGIPVKSKLTAVKDAMAASGKEFSLKKAALVTDGYGDIDLAKTIVTVLIKQHNPSTAQKVSYRLGLADYILPDNRDLATNLESVILGAGVKEPEVPEEIK